MNESLVSEGLISLTEIISKETKTIPVQGWLGGDYGYGINFENTIFMMHPYCWCEKDDCPWCGWDLEKDRAPNFRHKPSGQTVIWYKYIGRSMEIGDEIAGGLTNKLWLDILQDCIKSLKN